MPRGRFRGAAGRRLGFDERNPNAYNSPNPRSPEMLSMPGISMRAAPRRSRRGGQSAQLSFGVQNPYNPPRNSSRSSDYIGPGRGPK